MSICIIALFIAIIIYDFTDITILVFFLLLFLVFSSVSSADWSLLFIIPFFMILLLFFFLAGLFKKIVWICGFYFFCFELLKAGVFGGSTLGLDLWGNVVGRAITFRAIDIQVLDYDAKL